MNASTTQSAKSPAYLALHAEMTALIAALTAGNHNVETFNDGGDDEKYTGEVDALLGCDEVSLFVRCPDGKLRTIYCVFGNSPGELVCDFSAHPALEAIINACSDALLD